MKAIVIKQYGGSDQLVIKDIPMPQPEAGRVMIKVKAFGINRAETYMRRGMFGDVAQVTGIECVGQVEDDPSGKLKKGQTVAAIMGGMGRKTNGSYAEFTSVPAANVFVVHTNIPWEEFAALPESYATAWAALHGNLKLKQGDTVFIRGGSSALGQAAINIAANTAEVQVVTSTRNKDCFALLKELGARHVVLEDGNSSAQIRQLYPDGIDSVMDIVGNSTMLDSFKCVKKDGYVCNAGFLGGSDPILFNPLADMPCSVNFSFFASFNFGTKHYPLSAIPMQTIVDHATDRIYKALPQKILPFNEISQAHDLMESNSVHGKIVVLL
ncbi:zinc-binding dehydrogenase [Collimonas pratensis]|uniref:Zinc-binding dehydrogenase family protein n=1 Tax=Collimonas pratensis TaxID=279113 RepID=A0ABN4M3L7_9BURK|nr:zinc-binding dehydrogenase [Collimonas pratensis]AMP12600.1 zinc-binding dehydrogenase family protein [Collimonas pratensis]